MDKKKIKMLAILIGIAVLVFLVVLFFIISKNGDAKNMQTDGSTVAEQGENENDSMYESAIMLPSEDSYSNDGVFTIKNRSNEKFSFGGEKSTNTKNADYSMINIMPQHLGSTEPYGYYVTANVGLIMTNATIPYETSTEEYLSSPDEAPDVADFYMEWHEDVLRPASELTWGTDMESSLEAEAKYAGGIQISVRAINFYSHQCEGIFHINIEKNKDGKYAIASVEDGTIQYDENDPEAEINLVYKALDKKIRETDNAICLASEIDHSRFNITEEDFSNKDNILIEKVDHFYFPYAFTGGHWGKGRFTSEYSYMYEDYLPSRNILPDYNDVMWAATVNSPTQHSHMTYYFIPTQNSQVIAIEGPSMTCIAEDQFSPPLWEVIHADFERQRIDDEYIERNH